MLSEDWPVGPGIQLHASAQAGYYTKNPPAGQTAFGVLWGPVGKSWNMPSFYRCARAETILQKGREGAKVTRKFPENMVKSGTKRVGTWNLKGRHKQDES
jgi:hypothetical protein